MITRIVEEVVVEDLVDDLMVVIMIIIRTRMRLEVAIKTIGETILVISMIRIIEIIEQEVEDKDLEEEASMGNVFTMEKKKGIEHLNVPSAKEG